MNIGTRIAAAIGAIVTPLAFGGLMAASATSSSGAGSNGATHASATLRDIGGEVVGTARFTEDSTGAVHVSVHLHGLAEGLHGIHIHNIGSCASGATSFSGAGSHHNPLAATHGSHAGDMPNLIVNVAGLARLNTVTHGFTLTAGPTSVFDASGSAVIVHAGEDDLHTDPTGNSGGRVACGVIEAG